MSVIFLADVNEETIFTEHDDTSVCDLLDELRTLDVEKSTEFSLTDVTYTELYSHENQQIQQLIEKLQQTYNSESSILSYSRE